MIEFSRYSTHTASKQHTCDLCGDVIRIGEKYERSIGKHDGYFFETKHHLFCAHLIDKYCDWSCDSVYDNDNVIEWLRDTVCHDCVHSWFGDGDNDCTEELFSCPKVIAMYRNDGDDNG